MYSTCLDEIIRLLPALTRRQKEIVIELLRDLIFSQDEKDALINRYKEMDDE